MSNVLVEEASLQAIADMIRSKLGVADTYLPSEMADAIDDIGGGVTPTGTVNITTNGTHDVTQYASAAVAVPNSYSASDEGKVVNNGALVAQTSDTCTENGTVDTTLINSLTVNVSGGGGVDYLAQRCNNTITVYHSAEVVGLQGRVFDTCTSLEKVVFPNLANISHYNTFNGCSNLVAADFGGTFSTIQNNTFNGCSKLDTLIIRSASACNLGNINAFTSTPFASGGTGGTLYVPQSLISTYQGKNNWSTILGYANNSIQKIEGSIYETAYADGTPIT